MTVSPQTVAPPAPTSIVLFGTDEADKPRAARFKPAQADLAIKAAGLMNLRVFKVPNGNHQDLIERLPIGRLYANGHGFVPYVRRDLFTKLVDTATRPCRSAAAGRQKTRLVATTADNPAGKAAAGPAADLGGLPKSWGDVAPGHLVVAQESIEDGWWEAIVVKREGDLLTLRWRDYPTQPQIKRHLTTVALLHARPAGEASAR